MSNNKLLLLKISETQYKSENGFVMQREYGLTPHGNNINGFWVLRGPNSEWIDCNQFRRDLAERYGFKIE